MPLLRSFDVVRPRSALVVGISLLAIGCGDSNSGQSGKTVYSSPEEISAKDQGLKDAMQGGAYGSAGRKAAKHVGAH
ncbi:hypothetical protein [Singulisphaera sp. PoT]|uniref:hypothetical protein n=1 Tax=Singulisphaera sp. PoT TaxID=3411797 RepID=UPI003BF55CF6